MALKAKEQAVVDLVINGETAKTSLREVTGAVNALTAELSRAKKANDPEGIAKATYEWKQLKEVQTEMRKELFQTNQETDKFWDRVKSFALGDVIGGLVSSGLGKLQEIWSGSEQAYSEAQKVQTQLAAVLQSTGGAAGESIDELQKLQQTLMDLTGIDDDVIAKGEQMLLTFANVKGPIYEKALPAIVDMTSALNQGEVTMESIQQTSILVGKALNDPIAGMTALRRVGVSLDQQQQQQIKTLVENNRLMDAQTLILNELTKEFGGSAQAVRATSTGALEAFNTDMGNMQELIGAGIVALKAIAAEGFGPLIREISDTRSAAQKLSDEFHEQSDRVQGLEKNTAPLIERYDDLKRKGSLNRDEQTELKKVIGQLADTIPGAVTQWDKYGNALGINTDKARDFIRVQQALLDYQNHDAITATKEEIQNLTETRDQVFKALNSAKANKDGSFTVNGDTGTAADINNMRKGLDEVNKELLQKQDLLKGLNGSYMDDLAKKTDQTAKAVKSLTQMTVGDIEKYIEGLRESLKGTVIGSTAYTQITKQITDAEKVLNQAKDDTNVKSIEAARKKALEDLKHYQDQLKEAHAQVNQLLAAATKGTAEELDAQLRVIDDKYNKIIDKLKTLNKNKNATPEDIAKNNLDIGSLNEQLVNEKQKASDSFNFQNQEKLLNGNYSDKQSDLADQLAQDLITQKDYDDQSLQLEQDHLTDEYYLRLTWNQDTADIEKKLTDNKIALQKKEYDSKMAYLNAQMQGEQDFFRAQQEIADARNTLVSNGVSLLEDAFGKSKALAIAQIALEKAIAIGRIIANEGVEIAGYYASTALLGPFGWGIASAKAAMAVTRANLSIAGIVATGIGEAINVANTDSANKPKAAKGGVFKGASHADGGLDVVDPATGKLVVNVEGDEPFMVLSKDTMRNNGPLINKLLFNSMYRNGAAVDVAGVSSGIKLAKYGGVFSATQTPTFDQAYSTTSDFKTSAPTDNTRIDRLEAAVWMLHDAVKAESEKPVTLNRRTFDKDTEKNVLIDKRINA